MVSKLDMSAMLRLNVDMKSSPLTIGEAAAHFDLPTHVLRHWEAEGLLSPARVTGARRRYTREDMFRVALIITVKQAGLSLPAIREILTAPTPSERQAILHHQQAELQDRLTQLQTTLEMLTGAIACKHGDLITCPKFQSHLKQLVDQ
jgi:DNA-binding transcriptional MerR regulator